MSNSTTALAPTRARRAGPSASKGAAWSTSDDLLLADLATSSPSNLDWPTIALSFPDRSVHQVSDRWTKVLDPQLVKGSWTRAEDETIISFVRQFGTKSWKRLAELLPARIGKQCRERWFNALDRAVGAQRGASFVCPEGSVRDQMARNQRGNAGTVRQRHKEQVALVARTKDVGGR
jgi:hypothetical protein